MNTYIPADKLITALEKRMEETKSTKPAFDQFWAGQISAFKGAVDIAKSLQQEQPVNMIQWTGSNIKEVIDFTGKSPMFGEWFKSWDDFENYVNSHGRILKLFCEDGSHYELPVGAWIIKTTDGYNVPSVARFIHAKREQLEADLEKYLKNYFKGWHIEEEIGLTKPDGWSCIVDDLKGIARHFYELGSTQKRRNRHE